MKKSLVEELARLSDVSLLSEDVDGEFLDPSMVYDFYYLEFLNSAYGSDSDFSFIISERMNEIKLAYLTAFKSVVVKQLRKYASTSRMQRKIEPSEINDRLSTAMLDDMMKSVFRSDLERKNIRWSTLTKNLRSLEDETNVERIIYIIDRINNLAHNSKRSMLGKLSNGSDVYDAFEFASNAKTAQDLRTRISPRLRKSLQEFRAF